MSFIITDLKNSDTWKSQSKIAISFISSRDAEENGVKHSTSNNINFMTYSINERK